MENYAQPVLTDLSPAQLAAAVEENILALIPQFGRLGEYREDAPPGVKRAITDVKFALFNSIGGARLQPGQVENAVQRVIEDSVMRGIPLMWWTGPHTQPANLGEQLEARGFRKNDTPGMAVDLSALNEDLPVPPGFSVRRMEGEAGWRLWSSTNLRTWGHHINDYQNDPMCRLLRSASPGRLYPYVGFLDGEPVAVSLMHLGGGVAGIYSVATHSEARRMGIGARISLEPLLEARRLGYRAGVLESTEMGFNVYSKIGFKEVCRIISYAYAPEAS